MKMKAHPWKGIDQSESSSKQGCGPQQIADPISIQPVVSCCPVLPQDHVSLGVSLEQDPARGAVLVSSLSQHGAAAKV